MSEHNENKGSVPLIRGNGEGADTPGVAAPTHKDSAVAATSASTSALPHPRSVGDKNGDSSQPKLPRTPYVPQFSVATQMILKRMRGEPGGLTSALASATAPGVPRPKVSQHTYDSTRERIVANTSDNSGTLPISAGSSSPRTPSTTLPLPAPSPRPGSLGSPLTISHKRKRGKDDASDASSAAEALDYGEGIKKTTPKSTVVTPTTTKSGRHILKPDTYDPAADDNARKRNQLGKRTAEQALCKKCMRMHSPATNQMVFCDGCNDPWHQRCHEPWIEDEVVKDQSLNWYCAVCQAKRDRLQPRKKVAVERPIFGSWAGKSAAQKRAYFSGLAQNDLVNLLLRATEIHPELPIFPVDPPTSSTPKKSAANGMPRSLFAGTSTEGLFSRVEASPDGPVNFIRKIPANAKKSTMAKARSGPGTLQSKAAAQAQAIKSAPSGHQIYDEDDSSFTKLWPRPGKGMYSRLPPEADDDRQLVDTSDYDAFSVIVFNEKGKKIEENGVKV